jgi:hypothetical protein
MKNNNWKKDIFVCFYYAVGGYIPASRFFDSEEKAKKWVLKKGVQTIKDTEEMAS